MTALEIFHYVSDCVIVLVVFILVVVFLARFEWF